MHPHTPGFFCPNWDGQLDLTQRHSQVRLRKKKYMWTRFDSFHQLLIAGPSFGDEPALF